ncbi:TonB-dependent receptor [Marinicauda salina]|uniref:TonB-dependent receptor n=1 Tax=Marinicauda salina TaxID=2135793 RepID=A0A2U2BWR4_9PROT|nr:TonB-dependent receptor [Marinicauda salina]PWE18419.1 TonB-dependent receptor [Marinicauda salina]
MKTALLASAALAALSAPAFADAAPEDFPEIITVIGLTGDPDSLPGSADLITDADLEIHGYSDINRILRTVPGVNVQEEDGYGLRPNIGLRGTGLDRSAKITLMEDGVLIAPAPYAAPSAYYFPHAGRIAGVEIIKGAAGVRYGPRTQGGSINLLSTRIPEAPGGRLDLRAGEEGRGRIHAWAGGMRDLDGGSRIGGLIEGFYDRADGFKTIDNYADRGTGFEISDFVGRLRFETRAGGADHAFELKGQASDEISDETYLGLTDADFAADPFRRYAASAFDRMDADHSEISLRYAGSFDNGLELTAAAYRTDFARDWFKSDKVDLDGAGPGGTVGISAILDDPATFAAEFDVLTAPAGFTSAPGALLVKHNNREYYAQGFQAELAGPARFAGAEVQWRVGGRLHEDEMDRFQWYERFQTVDGEIVFTSEDTPGTESNRIDSAEAFAAFAQADLTWGAFTLIPGVRYETVDLLRENFGGGDPARTGASLAVTENTVDWFAPGLGARYEINERVTVFGGVHRGFSPPGPGSTTAEPEEATNYELGARFDGEAASLEAVAFYNDYSNILGSCTASTGGGCVIGDQFDGGEVEISGLELTAEADLGATVGARFAAPVRVAYTYTDAEFQTGFASDYDPWGTVEAGDALPYIPEHQLTVSAGLEFDRVGGEISANWTDDVRTVSGQGAIPADERVDSRWVADLALWASVTDRVEARLNVRNLFDETYAVARRPAGLRPGAPRAVTVGLAMDF